MSYRELKSYQQGIVVYDMTVRFCKLYISGYSRTRDQMEQAARSGKQNIVEASSERTSESGELKLLGVARASWQELLEDYEDFLRQKGMGQWTKDSQEAMFMRELYKEEEEKRKAAYEQCLKESGRAANCAICLIHQVNFLLDRQIRVAEEKFVREGGYRENLRRRRDNEIKREIISREWRKRS